MTEAQLWQLVKRNVEGHLVRIENTSGSGTPDVHGCSRGQDMWIELKLAKGRWLYFRSSQLAWFAKRQGAGGKVRILFRKLDEIYITSADEILKLIDQAVPNKDKSVRFPIEIIPSQKFFKPWDWSVIRNNLFSVH